MNRFLDNLAARLQNPAETIQPRTPSRFEPEAAASPRPFFAPETIREETEGLEDGPPQAPETVSPERGSPRRPLSRPTPAGPLPPAALSEDAAAPQLVQPPPAARRDGADGPQAPAQAARPAAPTGAPTPEPISFRLGLARDEAGAEVPRPPATSALLVSPAPQASDEEPTRVTPRARPMTFTGSPVSEAGAMFAPAPRPMKGSHGDIPVLQASESLAATERAQPGARVPQSPSHASDPARVSAPAASAKRGDALETPGHRPAVTIRAAPPPAARPSNPVAREAPLPAPTIQVTIGRIEVRAAPPAPRAASPRPAPAKLTLEEYLRDGGRK